MEKDIYSVGSLRKSYLQSLDTVSVALPSPDDRNRSRIFASSGMLRRVAHIPEDAILHSHRRENLKSDKEIGLDSEKLCFLVFNSGR
jgi:hypothetical protein